jgi:hypothetical protein
MYTRNDGVAITMFVAGNKYSYCVVSGHNPCITRFVFGLFVYPFRHAER